MAEVVAATHDAHEARYVHTMSTLWQYITISLCERKRCVDSILTQFALRNKVRKRQIGVRSCHKIGVIMLYKLILDALCHTSEHTENYLAVLILIYIIQRLKTVINLVFSILTH